jgi:hypothetical protein
MASAFTFSPVMVQRLRRASVRKSGGCGSGCGGGCSAVVMEGFKGGVVKSGGCGSGCGGGYSAMVVEGSHAVLDAAEAVVVVAVASCPNASRW